jgi:two-component SAPR family response regulator
VLDLLQAIVALGPREASRERLTELVWPDAEGDGASDAFDVALHRLRRLIGEDAVVLEHGQVSLARSRVWTDAQAFERLADQIHKGADKHNGNGTTYSRAVDKALTLYGGHFLANEPERPWMLSARERLRMKFERVVEHAGAHYEQSGELGQAAGLYRRAIELDPLAEGFYRKLMTCHARAGDTAEALEVYRRCRHVLSVVLGVRPSPKTDALRASLHP